MPVVGRGDADRVDFLDGQDVAEVFLGLGAYPSSRCASVANLAMMLLSTSQMAATRPVAAFAFSEERCAYPRPFSPMMAKFSRSLAPMICA
jgi:hypothetical protein